MDVGKINLITTVAGTGELQALKASDLDGLVLWSPIIDGAMVEGYGYYPPAVMSALPKRSVAATEFFCQYRIVEGSRRCYRFPEGILGVARLLREERSRGEPDLQIYRCYEGRDFRGLEARPLGRSCRA